MLAVFRTSIEIRVTKIRGSRRPTHSVEKYTEQYV